MDTSIPKYIQHVQIYSSGDRLRLYHRIRNHLFYTLIHSLRNTDISRRDEHRRDEQPSFEFNKVFASEWYDAHSVILGTKCNKLLLLDIQKESISDIKRPEDEQRATRAVSLACDRVGNYSVASNQSQTLIATGGSNPHQICVLDRNSFKPRVSLVGHSDWVLGCAWVSDTHVASGSRDGRVALWNIDSQHQEPCALQADESMNHRVMRYSEGHGNQGMVMSQPFPARVRDVKYEASNGFVAALCGDSSVKILDPCRDLQKVRSCCLPHRPTGSFCMGVQCNTVAMGRSDGVTLFDPRKRGISHNIASPSRDAGVRSIEFHNNSLSFGTGSEALAIFDARMWKHAKELITPDSPSCYGVLNSHMRSSRVEHQMRHTSAIFTHTWHPHGSSIFLGGGPLSHHDDGHFCALWH